MYQELRGKDKYAELIEAQRRAAAGWIAQAEGRSDEAANLLRSAADLEESIEKHPVTPGAVLPARELLGDLLLAQEKPADALKAYEATLAHSPGRFNSVAGAMRAARRSGDDAAAQRYARELLKIGAQADTERPDMTEAKRIANGQDPAGRSDPDNLREVIEMPVSGVKGQIVLQHESRQPDIVRRNRCALLPELTEN